MACYRLTFKNGKVFEVIVERAAVAGGLRDVYTAAFYRLTRGAREHAPLQRADGRPLQVVALDEETAIVIARDVLAGLTGGGLEQQGPCGDRSHLPPLPNRE